VSAHRRAVRSADEPVIALVASAGGLSAVFRILGGLALGLHASVVVLIHHAPDHESHLAGLLARRCPLPVAEAQHGAQLLPGEVVVVPAGKHMLITSESRTALIASGAFPPSRPSADLLLATLATAVGPRAIAVILSGHGHDGATGAAAVHACGGTVLASDQATSTHNSMPRAAIERDHTVDHIVSLDEIAERLQALAGSAPVPVTPRTTSDAGLRG
jgi:two-component system, chemotaxis family, protein-glutamate methylesterase/glutaminase